MMQLKNVLTCIGVPGGGGGGGPWPPLGKNIQLGRTELGGLAEKKLTVWQKRISKLKSAETEHGQHSPFPSYFANFSAKFILFSAIFVWFLPYLPIFLPFLSVFQSSFSNFCPMLRLAEQCDTKEWYISLAERNWRIWPSLRGHYFGRTGLSFGRKKLLAPPKK